METSDVSIFAVRVQSNELKSRMEMTAIVNRRRMRHAHMVNINRQIMLEGMRADFNLVDALSNKVMAIVGTAREITGKTAAGCDFTTTLNPDYRWIKTSASLAATSGETCRVAKSLPLPRGKRGLRCRWSGGRFSLRHVWGSSASGP